MVDNCKLECHVKRLDCCVQLFKVMVRAEVKKQRLIYIFQSRVFCCTTDLFAAIGVLIYNTCTISITNNWTNVNKYFYI